MAMTDIAVPDDLLSFFGQSHLARHTREDQVKIALAAHLLQEGVISAGKAATLAGIPRAEFELLLGQMGIPPGRFTESDYARERDAFTDARANDARRG